MNTYPIRAEEQDAAEQWWINRFCRRKTEREFLLQLHNHLPKTSDKRSRWKEYVKRNQHLMIDFVFKTGRVHVLPTTTEAAWAAGEIFKDLTGKFRYYSTPVKNLFIESEEENDRQHA